MGSGRIVRVFGTALAGIGLWISMSGLMPQPFPQRYNPYHYVNDDPAWTLLNEADVSTDIKEGQYTATFPADLVQLQFIPFKISGFIMPLETSQQTIHFILVRRNTACPFCPPNAPTEAVEIFAQTPVKYSGDVFTVRGRLRLVSSSANGLFYRIEAAQVTPGG